MIVAREPASGARPEATIKSAEGSRDALVAAPPRRLTLVGPLPPPSGGMANQTRQLASLLAAEGTDVRIVQTNAPYTPAWVGKIPVARAVFRLVPYLFRLWRDINGADAVHVMANSGWAWHLFAAPAIWIARLRGVPAVVNYRGGDAAAFFARQVRWIRPSLRRVAEVIVPSGFLRAVFAAHGVSATIVPNVVNLEAFRPAAEAPRSPHLVVTRNLEPIYDIGTAIAAFALVAKVRPGARLTIAGSGPERAALERFAAEQGVGLSVRFTGRLDNAELPELYRSATLMLNPARIDNMPNSLLEAMASGVPIVSTDVGGIPYLVADGVSALLVPLGDARAMARAALRILDDPALGVRLARAGLEASRGYAWAKVRSDLFAVYARAGQGNARTSVQA